MLPMRKLLVIAAASLLWSAPGHSQDAARDRLEAVLLDCSRNGYIEMEMYTVSASREAEALGGRMNEAIQRDPDWFQEYLRKHADERPLPYHEKFGLTKQEYFRFFEIFEKTRRFVAVRKGRITVTSKGNGRFRLDGARSIPWLGNIVIDLKKLAAEIPGHAPLAGKAHQDGLLEPVGKVEGFVWKSEEPAGDLPAKLADFNAHMLRLVVASDRNDQLVIQFKDMKVVEGERDPDHTTDTIMRYTGRSTLRGNLQ